MIATALLYSGIENPHWVVPPARAAEVARAMEAMTELHQPRPSPGGLGYAGISISVPTPIRDERIWTFGNGIAVSAGRCFSDVKRRIERMILETGRGQIDAKVFAYILGTSFPVE